MLAMWSELSVLAAHLPFGVSAFSSNGSGIGLCFESAYFDAVTAEWNRGYLGIYLGPLLIFQAC